MLREAATEASGDVVTLSTGASQNKQKRKGSGVFVRRCGCALEYGGLGAWRRRGVVVDVRDVLEGGSQPGAEAGCRVSR